MQRPLSIFKVFIAILIFLFSQPLFLRAQSPELVLPKNNFTGFADSMLLSWDPIANAVYYELETANDPAFTIGVATYNVFSPDGDTTLTNLTLCSSYYWKVRAFTPAAGAFSYVHKFSVYSPRCVSGLELWLSADTGVVADAFNNISEWKDRSGNAKDAVQAIGTNQPLIRQDTGSASNLSSFVKLDGSDDFLSIAQSANLASFFGVIKWAGSIPNFSGYNTVIMSQTVIPKGLVLLGIPTTTNYYIDGTFNTFNASELNVNTVSTANLSPINKLKLVDGVKNAPTNLPDFFIGKFPGDATSFWNGDIGELLMYNSTLNSSQRSSVQNYLMDKYAPPVDLGKNITVCGFPITLHPKKIYFTNYLWQDASTGDSLVISAPGIYYVSVTDVFDRVSADTISVSQDASSFTADLGSDKCSDQPVILFGGPPHLNYVWSNGAISNSIKVSTTGTYWVSVTDCFGTTSFDTVNVTIHALPSFSLGADLAPCFSMGALIDPGFINSASYTFLWSDSSTDSTLFVNSSGAYWLKVTDQNGCIFKDTVNVAVDSSLFSATLGPDTSLCSGNFIYLQSGAAQTSSYLWSDSSTNDSLQIIASGLYYVSLTNTNGCTKTDSINIAIAGNAPVASFAATNACFGNATVFTDGSSPPTGDTLVDWNWNFGDAGTSALTNPVHIYADTGTYTVSLTVTTNAGCFASVLKTVHVYPFPVATFTAANLCEDAGAAFTANATTSGYPITSWNWNFGDPSSGTFNTSSLQNPGHDFLAGAVYPVTLIATSIAGCADTVINNITIKQGPVANFTSSLGCGNDPVQFNDASTMPPATVLSSNLWNFGDALTSTVLNPSHIYAFLSTFNVTHIVTASNGCKDTIITPLTVNPKPTVAFSPLDDCVDVPFAFLDMSFVAGGTITGWDWTFGGTGTSTVQNPVYTFTSSGTPGVQLIATTNTGCTDTLVQAVNIHPAPVAGFTFTPNYGSPPLFVNFTNTSTGAAFFSWDFNDGSALSNMMNPSHNYTDTGSFQISLIAQSSFGCVDTMMHTLNLTNRLMDVAVADFTTSLQNNFLSVTAQFDNHGSTDVHTMEVYLKVNDGFYIRENWGGSLLRNGSVLYTFTTSLFVADDQHYVCVSVQKPNGFDDDVPADNELCNPIDVGGFQTFAAYPNPVNGIITLPVFLPSANDLNISIYNARGKKVEEVFSGTMEEGFHAITYNTIRLDAGLYLFKITYKNEKIIQKFIKN